MGSYTTSEGLLFKDWLALLILAAFFIFILSSSSISKISRKIVRVNFLYYIFFCFRKRITRSSASFNSASVQRYWVEMVRSCLDKYSEHHNLNGSSEYIRYNERNLKGTLRMIGTSIERNDCKTASRKEPKKGNVVNGFCKLKIV